MPIEFLRHITPTELILTANSRLARYLLNAYPTVQPASNTVWETPRILPLKSWLEQTFSQTNQDGLILLSDFQEQCLWEEIIQKTALSQTLLQPAQLAKLTKQAFETLTLWQVSLDTLEEFSSQPNVQFLIDTIQQFQQRCRDKQWITQCELPALIQLRDTQNIQKPVDLPTKITLIGFDDFNPSVTALLDHWKTKTTIELKTLIQKNNSVKQIILEDTETELTTMARWAKAQWTLNPNARIGCIIPDLASCRARVQHIFTEVFSIETILPNNVNTVAPFNISAGKSLAQQPMIYIALALLKWRNKAMPIDELAHILQSPYVSQNEADVNMGAQLDRLLRERNYLHVTIADLFSVIPTLQPHYPDNTWLMRLRGFLQIHVEQKNNKQNPSQWATHFITLLKTLAWPGNRTQNSEEFQLLERFKKVCQEFSQLDAFYASITDRKALQLLSTLINQTQFQPKSHHEPIQIMGVLEASGILFDAVWMMGLHDIAWPMATKPHPLIPFPIQQQHQMPHATAKRELHFCENMTHRLQHSATTVIMSSPAKNGDQHYSPSRLIHALPMTTLADITLSAADNYCDTVFNSKKIENFEDNHALPVTDFSAIRGGSHILKLQAECPFRAFASIRLKARELNSPQMGIPAKIKGELIHQILFELWGELIDHTGLCAREDAALHTLIHDTIEKVFTEQRSRFIAPTHSYFFAVEKKRLQSLITEWLDFEKSRPYFRVIDRETTLQIDVKQLPLTLRLDRVDQLSDGSLLLIDYKTGASSMNGWFQERLTDPQLPLYAVFQGESGTHYHGLGFAQVRAGKMTFEGVIHENHLYADQKMDGLIPIHRLKKSEGIYSWEALQLHWRESLEKLSDDFCQGIATANPIDPVICDTCDMKSICRYKQ